MSKVLNHISGLQFPFTIGCGRNAPGTGRRLFKMTQKWFIPKNPFIPTRKNQNTTKAQQEKCYHPTQTTNLKNQTTHPHHQGMLLRIPKISKCHIFIQKFWSLVQFNSHRTKRFPPVVTPSIFLFFLSQQPLHSIRHMTPRACRISLKNQHLLYLSTHV